MNTANTDYPKPFFKPIEELTFTDDFMFGCIMKNEYICRGVLERLLRMKIGKIEYPTLQKSISPFYESKGIRLDVYFIDLGSGSIFIWLLTVLLKSIKSRNLFDCVCFVSMLKNFS